MENNYKNKLIEKSIEDLEEVIDIDENINLNMKKFLSKDEKLAIYKSIIKNNDEIRKIHRELKLFLKLDQIDEFLPIIIDISIELKNIENYKMISSLTYTNEGFFQKELIKNLKYKNLKQDNLIFPFLTKKTFTKKSIENLSLKINEKDEIHFKKIFLDFKLSKELNYLGIYYIENDSKSTLFEELATHFIYANKQVIFSSFKTLSEFLKNSFFDLKLYKKNINILSEIDALFIENIFFHSLNKWMVNEIFFNIILNRLEKNKLTFLSCKISLEYLCFILTKISMDFKIIEKVSDSTIDYDKNYKKELKNNPLLNIKYNELYLELKKNLIIV